MASAYIKVNTGAHDLIDNKSEKKITNLNPIVIENNVWLGMGSILLSGAKIGSGSIVGAGAIVTSEFPSNCTLAGSPARVLRHDVTWQQ